LTGLVGVQHLKINESINKTATDQQTKAQNSVCVI